MSKVKNKFFVFILILGIICSSFLFSACNFGGLNKNNNQNYSNNTDGNSNPIKTEFKHEQIWETIDTANKKISYAILDSNVYLNISQDITDYYFDDYGNELAEPYTAKSITNKYLSISSAYESTYDEDYDQLAEYWYIPNVQQKAGESEEDALASSSSYTQYYKSTIGGKSTYYKPKTINERWAIITEETDSSSNNLQIFVSKKPNDSNHNAILTSGFINEQIAEFYTGFADSEASKTLTMQQLSDYSFKISFSYKQEEFGEQFDPDTGEEVEVLLGTTFYSYDFHLDRNGRLISSEYSVEYEMLFEKEDNTEDNNEDAQEDYLNTSSTSNESETVKRIVSKVKTKIDVEYNKQGMPVLQKEKWN